MMKIYNSIACLTVAAALAFRVGAACAASAEACLGQMLSEGVTNAVLGVALRDSIQVELNKAAAVAERQDIVATAYAERMAASMEIADRREWVEIKVIDSLFRHMALTSPAVSNALSAFRYSELLMRYAGDRLIREVSGQMDGFTLTPQFFECGDYEGGLLLLPRQAVQMKAIALISDQETRALYAVALVRNAKDELERQQYEAAAHMLLEARKYGFMGKDLFLDLYKCYLLSGDAASARRISELLMKDYAGQVSFSDCIELARLAEESSSGTEKDYWYGHAEQTIRKGVSLDMFMPD